MNGLENLRRPEDVAKLRGLSVRQVLGIKEPAEARNGGKDEGAEKPTADEQPAAGTEES
jgi:hypothetical protein